MIKNYLAPFVPIVLMLSVISCESSEQNSAEKKVRINVFYSVSDDSICSTVENLAGKLVESSRNDNGCISYDFLKSTTTPREYLIVETWENDSLLTLHSNTSHFMEYVPQLKSLGKMKSERFYITK